MATVVRTFEEAGQRLVLRDLGTHHELLLGQVPILSSAALATERAFGELARHLARGGSGWAPRSVPSADSGNAAQPPAPPTPPNLAPASGARVLVGGLGFGATLAGVLASVASDAEVVVVEKLSTVVELLRGDLAHLAPGAMDDPRVRLVQDDVAEVIARERDLDLILLDVDNGPGWASFRTNARLYAPEGLARAHAALRSGGSFAVWSGYPADAFVAQLRRAGFVASTLPLRERGQVRARAYVGRVA